jgi:phosphotransferase system enzyme I (PtsP)
VGPLELEGMGTARGIAIGPVYRLEGPIDLADLDYKPSQSVEQEEEDLLRAIHEARHDLDDTRDELGHRFGPDFAAVFNTHIQILEDKGFVAKLRSEVRTSGSALGALVNVLAAYRTTFARIGDRYFRERMLDVEDVGRRVMERILGERPHVGDPGGDRCRGHPGGGSPG